MLGTKHQRENSAKLWNSEKGTFTVFDDFLKSNLVPVGNLCQYFVFCSMQSNFSGQFLTSSLNTCYGDLSYFDNMCMLHV